jgi:DNA polymerase-1
LLEEFGDLETLLNATPKDQAEQAARKPDRVCRPGPVSRELVTLKTDVPVDTLDGQRWCRRTGPTAHRFLKAMEFTTLTRRVAEADRHRD